MQADDQHRGADPTVTMKLHRPDADGNLAPTSATVGDYRTQLRSRRWDAAPLKDNEVELPDKRLAVLGIALISALTFGIIVVGYAVGLWS
jgi:hypothetical protein